MDPSKTTFCERTTQTGKDANPHQPADSSLQRSYSEELPTGSAHGTSPHNPLPFAHPPPAGFGPGLGLGPPAGPPGPGPGTGPPPLPPQRDGERPTAGGGGPTILGDAAGSPPHHFGSAGGWAGLKRSATSMPSLGTHGGPEGIGGGGWTSARSGGGGGRAECGQTSGQIGGPIGGLGAGSSYGHRHGGTAPPGLGGVRLRSPKYIYIISDGTGFTASHALTSIMAQFDTLSFDEGGGGGWGSLTSCPSVLPLSCLFLFLFFLFLLLSG